MSPQAEQRARWLDGGLEIERSVSVVVVVVVVVVVEESHVYMMLY